MSVFGPASAFLLVGGRNISSDTFVLDETLENLFEETHGLGDSWEEHLPVGIGKILLEASGGIYDDATDRIVDALQEKGETKQMVAYGFSDPTGGRDCVLLDGTYAATWKRMASRTGLTKAHAIHMINSEYRRGLIIHGLTAEGADGTSASVDLNNLNRPDYPITASSIANPTEISLPAAHGLTTGDVVLISNHVGSTPSINGGDGYPITVTGLDTFTILEDVTVGGTLGTYKVVSLRGAEGHLHIPAITLGGYTDLTVDIEDSADDTTFAPYVAFSAATAVGAEKVVEATVCNRFLQINWTWGGAGSGQSVIPFVGIAET
jgi:hypothetical protein